MEDASTDTLRAAAPKWSLAGDDQLLSLLQCTHQKIITKCQDVNSKLEEMASALDDASINLQNVNNKFMALSNSQFIESRVYDDEEELTAETQPAKEPPQLSPIDELSILKSSLSILERAHETAEIMDDSDSDSDTEISVVLKPKDMYSHRPLPHIIGTQPWKNKWHAGLIVEDSDSDSSTSKRDDRELDQYSDSESEVERPQPPVLEDRTISETSSSFHSSQGLNETHEPAPAESAAPVRRAPADIAAELARRLGGPAQIVDQEPEEYSPPAPTTRKIYKPEQPETSNIFPDEPPPLDSYEPEESQSEDDDIFAEINKNKPYNKRSTTQNLTEDLFQFDKPYGVEQGDIFSDFAPRQVETKSSSKQKSTLFEDESEPELFAEQPHKSPKKEFIQNNNNVEKHEDNSTKKPVGGISLFGSTKGAESIGAAILNRNRRKSSTSGDESESDNIPNRAVKEKPKIISKNIEKSATVAKHKTVDVTDTALPKKEKDIFDDLFAKSEKTTGKKPAQKIVKETIKEKEKTSAKERNVKDLFSDNIFDDIDDIFTSNIKIPSKDSNQKSIFDDEDLFSDIAKPKSNNQSSSKDKHKASSKDKQSIFDSDDDLFSDVKTITDKTSTKNIESHNTKTVRHDQAEISKPSNENVKEKEQEAVKVVNIVKSTEITKERNLFDDSPQNIHKSEKPHVKSKGLFDSDSDEDIFANIQISNDNKANEPENVLKNTNDSHPEDREDSSKPAAKPKHLATESANYKKETNFLDSPSLFEEEEIDELFINSNKLINDSIPVVPENTKIAEVKNMKSLAKDTMIASDMTLIEKETNTFSHVYSKGNNNLPAVSNEPETKVTEKSVLVPIQEIVVREDNIDDDLVEDNIFPSSKKMTNYMPRENIDEEILTNEVIETSQEVSDSRAEEAKVVSNVESVETESQFHDTKSRKKMEIVIQTQESQQTNKQQDTNQSEFDDFVEPVEEKEVFPSDQKRPIWDEPDIFDDILTEPPAFEKPLEPKKSKNVNALFDDDSDDESLFFKKNDIISDEKPETFLSNNANFDIFISEPPAIDVDFTTKSTKTTALNDGDDIFRSVPEMKESKPKTTKNLEFEDNGEDLFNSMPQIEASVPNYGKSETEVRNVEINTPKITNEAPEKKSEYSSLEVEKHAYTDIHKTEEKIGVEISDSDDDFFSSFPKPNEPKSSQLDELFEQNKTLKSNVVEKNKTADEFDDIFGSKDSATKDTETKKIGKINTKNFNINVNALIPGASPKKVPKEQKEDQSTSNQEPENISKMVKQFPTSDETDNFTNKKIVNNRKDDNKEKIDPEPTKSITLKEKQESEILDNNASKQRAKIQVKRRPSTRRARHEAARRSVIGFGDDTDNSSSFDEPVKARPVKSIKVSKEDTDSQIIEIKQKETVKNNQSQDKIEDKSNNTQTEVIPSENIFHTNEDSNTLPLNYSQNDNKEYQNEVVSSSEIKTETRQGVKQNVNEQKGTTTKVVYILNDEDIFNTGAKNLDTKSEKDLFDANNVETKSGDDIFNSIAGVKTLGKTYKEHTREPTEVIKKDDTTTKIAAEVIKKDEIIIIKDTKSSQSAKTSLFDDSDEEFFNKCKKVAKKKIVFDSDSEEELFSGKKTTEKQSKEQKNREVKERKEVNVKGSLFGDDDDNDDLFGVKKETSGPKQTTSKPSTSKETASMPSKSAELVFDDPLSMLGDDD